jgi:hypothetical protein
MYWEIAHSLADGGATKELRDETYAAAADLPAGSRKWRVKGRD